MGVVAGEIWKELLKVDSKVHVVAFRRSWKRCALFQQVGVNCMECLTEK